LTNHVNGFIILAKKNQAHHIESYVETHFKDRVLCRNWGEHYAFVLELYTPHTNKGKGLEYVADYLGFQKHQIIAFGDAHNDIEMLEYAHLGVAMKNAQDRLKIHADEITEFSNTEDGLIKHIETILNRK
jgi:hydroxymethylpyrimidine pyrophosphatase-like HAD family hydrolase